ncbi:conserved protein of unknown function (plasmid) [Rhodovastum atsumiense]|uniref:Uncharacterized protein n=1 Tax=Rhodovastum atsumiense TaxID=504468 RepID=A0A5M6IWP0_9PROT|nr:hypothetical protein [Rhodovastum atsumiense]KAA5611795.1 hypothetical protein F1189_12200 [Rhodovastum atsumiense]CAH2606097.1 conserved protein of unknown function [Rhodovastum atsumiense]
MPARSTSERADEIAHQLIAAFQRHSPVPLDFTKGSVFRTVALGIADVLAAREVAAAGQQSGAAPEAEVFIGIDGERHVGHLLKEPADITQARLDLLRAVLAKAANEPAGLNRDREWIRALLRVSIPDTEFLAVGVAEDGTIKVIVRFEVGGTIEAWNGRAAFSSGVRNAFSYRTLSSARRG